MTTVDPADSAVLNPWQRYGWIAQSIWLLFLIFPIQAVASSGHGVAAQVTSYVLIFVFGAVYAVGAWQLDRAESRGRSITRAGAGLTAVLLTIQVSLFALIGIGALGLSPFVVSFAMFVLPLLASLLLGAIIVAATWVLVLILADGPDNWVIGVITLAVAVMTAAMRVVVDRSIEQDKLAGELLLIAERERVSRDVHDVLGHSLTALTVKSELAERLLDSDVERARAELRQIQDISRTALAEIRATVGGLRVARLDDELSTARDALTSKGIAADIPDEISGVDPRYRILFAWVLREAVTNVVRHSDARHCTVELDSNRIAVLDDGPGREIRQGNGLRGLAERVAAARGTMTVEQIDTGGTRLEVTV